MWHFVWTFSQLRDFRNSGMKDYELMLDLSKLEVCRMASWAHSIAAYLSVLEISSPAALPHTDDDLRNRLIIRLTLASMSTALRISELYATSLNMNGILMQLKVEKLGASHKGLPKNLFLPWQSLRTHISNFPVRKHMRPLLPDPLRPLWIAPSNSSKHEM